MRQVAVRIRGFLLVHLARLGDTGSMSQILDAPRTDDLPGARRELRIRARTRGSERACDALGQAALGGRLNAVRLLLSKGASVDAADPHHGHSALHLAAMADNAEVVQA